jgi:F-type H+-transporting ATPase subunit gamma
MPWQWRKRPVIRVEDSTMPNLKDIRKRIASVKNTQKITKAMKMVAAAKLRRAQDRLVASRPYAHKLGQVIASLSTRVEEGTHPLLEARESRERILVIVVSSNRGLCGGFNSNLFRTVDRFIREHEVGREQIDILTVGRKANGFFTRQEMNIIADRSDIIGQVTYKQAKELAEMAIEDFLSKKYDAIYLAYNQFISAIAFETVIRPLLPFNLDDVVAAESGGEMMSASSEYIYEPNVGELLDRLLPGHVEVQVLQALFESEASEQGSRMTAMDNATNNATDMIARLTLQYNRARQAYITREIVEIVSGAESLKG